MLLPPALLIVEINPAMQEHDAERRRLIEPIQHHIKIRATLRNLSYFRDITQQTNVYIQSHKVHEPQTSKL